MIRSIGGVQMEKKIIIIFVFLMLLITNIYAGDIPEGIMLGQQQALFIGKIIAINEETYTMHPSTIMMGSIEESEIQVQKFDKYYGTNQKPKVGDFVVAVLLKKGTVDDLWIFKATSDNYKTLKLKSERHNMVTRYEKYINEGKYFEAQKKLDDKNSTIKSNINTNMNTSTTVSGIDGEKIPNNEDSTSSVYTILVIISILILSGFLLWLKIKAGKKSDSIN